MHYLWNEEKVSYPPAKKEIILAYSDINKVSLSFLFDLSKVTNSYLDPAKPIIINGKIVQIPDLPHNPLLLRVVEKSDIDVTKLIHAGPIGEKNIVEINYILSPIAVAHGFLSRKVGTLTLYFTVCYGEKEEEKKIINEDIDKFCMHCGRSVRYELSTRFCQYCGGNLIVGGTNPKSCRNCNKIIPEIAKFCPKCGKDQPH